MRKILLLVFSFVAVFAFAIGKDSANAVSFVEYDQSFADMQGSLSLKNNTDEQIKNIRFRIIYLNMKGKELDYEDYSIKADIAPGMVRQVEIPAYQASKNYAYHKSEHLYGNNKVFKIKFELLGYNDAKTVSKERGDHVVRQQSIMPTMIMLVALVFIIGVYVGLYALVAVMAQRRGRSAAMWIVVSLLGTPFLSILILLIIGKSRERYDM